MSESESKVSRFIGEVAFLIGYYRKAVLGAITPSVIALVAAVQDASPAGSSITGPEWVGIIAAGLLTGGIVGAVPNKD